MRALFYSPKGAGHMNPTLPLVWGLVERRHDVTYVLTSEWKDRLEGMGCRYLNMGKGEVLYALHEPVLPLVLPLSST